MVDCCDDAKQYIHTIKFDYHDYKNKKSSPYLDISEGYDVLEVDINYCPWCGKKLKC